MHTNLLLGCLHRRSIHFGETKSSRLRGLFYAIMKDKKMKTILDNIYGKHQLCYVRDCKNGTITTKQGWVMPCKVCEFFKDRDEKHAKKANRKDWVEEKVHSEV
jgi:hypothetical protein